AAGAGSGAVRAARNPTLRLDASGARSRAEVAWPFVGAADTAERLTASSSSPKASVLGLVSAKVRYNGCPRVPPALVGGTKTVNVPVLTLYSRTAPAKLGSPPVIGTNRLSPGPKSSACAEARGLPW